MGWTSRPERGPASQARDTVREEMPRRRSSAVPRLICAAYDTWMPHMAAVQRIMRHGERSGCWVDEGILDGGWGGYLEWVWRPMMWRGRGGGWVT